MKYKKGSTKNVLNASQNFIYVLIMEGVLTGLIAGLIAVVYRILLDQSQTFIMFMADFLKNHTIYIIGWFLLLVLLALLVTKLLAWEPLISGSGIPQVEGEMMSFIDQKWKRIIPAKMLGGVCCAFAGLSLGREGPSIQLGAMAGKGVAKVLHRVKMEERMLLTCGAAAGLSAAFNAPLAGVMFALEELHKNFSVSALISVMCASLTGDFLSRNIFGLDPAFHFVVQETLPLAYYGIIILLGVVTGIFGVLYNKSISLSQLLFEKVPFFRGKYKLIIPFMVAGVLLFIMPEVLCGGHFMIEMLTENNIVLRSAVLLLLVKWAFSQLSFGSGAPGGIFFPMLVMGSFIGFISGSIAISVFHIPSMYMNNIIIMAMAGTFAAIVRAPITGIILIAEMSGTLTHLLPLGIVSLVAYLCASLLRSEPVYEGLLHRLLVKRGVDVSAFHGERHLVEVSVTMDSKVCNQMISNIPWPNKCLIVSVKRSGKEVLPKGDTILYVGDILVTLLQDEDAPYVQHELEKLCSEGIR